jgi:hypothetical protein
MSRNSKFENLHAYLRVYWNHAVTKSPYIIVFLGNKFLSIKDCIEHNTRILQIALLQIRLLNKKHSVLSHLVKGTNTLKLF